MAGGGDGMAGRGDGMAGWGDDMAGWNESAQECTTESPIFDTSFAFS